MADETLPNQRPVVIGAIIVAALVAAGLWYFFVFRPATPEELVIETATPTPAATDAAGVALEPTPLAAALTPETIPAPAHVPPTAPTGMGQTILLAAVAPMVAGLWGLRQLGWTRAHSA